MTRATRAHKLAVALLLCLPATGQAQGGQQEAEPGRLVERVVSPSDATQAYAIYLPSAYTDSSEWPILLLLDPRGRALVPMRLFQPAAERNGWIVLSSYNTLSDGPAEPNVHAVNAMLADALGSFSLDNERLYFAGFSGTARVAWDFAAQLGGRVAGIFGASAGPNAGPALLMSTPPAQVAFYGTAGVLDFNHDEMLVFRDRLERWELPYRLRIFAGGHSWPPDSLASEALDWFDLQAMRAGVIPPDSPRITRFFHADSVAASARLLAGDHAAAYQRYREIARDYTRFRDVEGISARARELADNRNVKRAEQRQRQLLQLARERERRIFDYFDRIRAMLRPPALRDALRELDVARLQREASSDDTLKAQAAARSLEQIFVHASFYLPRELRARGDRERALAVLEIAAAIKPDHPQVQAERTRVSREPGG